MGANSNITFRIVNYGGTSSSGTWHIYDTAGSTALDFAIQGTVTQVLSVSAATPSFSSLTFSNNQFQFMLNGTTGSNYVVQVSTNLATSNWISVTTNAAPFTFTGTNANLLPQRFYRAVVTP